MRSAPGPFLLEIIMVELEKHIVPNRKIAYLFEKDS